jgi:predicted esterase
LVRTNDYSDELFDSTSRSKTYLISNKTGKTIKSFPAKAPLPGGSSMLFSATGNHLVWFDAEVLKFYCFDIKKDRTYDLSKKIPERLYYKCRQQNASYGWFFDANSAHVYIYDEYDCWKINLDHPMLARNIFLGYGRKQKIILGLYSQRNDGKYDSKGDTLITGYDPVGKQNGIGFLVNGLVSLKMHNDRHLYATRYNDEGWDRFPNSYLPIKATSAHTYLAVSQSATVAPNWMVTDDFEQFTEVSELHPQLKYNWLTTELLNWTADSGKKLQGILYKPENFDPSKKYPLILNYYTKVSDQYNSFLYPNYVGHNINVPYFVSNGYLVLLTDLDLDPLDRPNSALGSVRPILQLLYKASWLDQKHIGIQGHSHGGYVTNCLITESDLFKAACEFAGTSNLISAYGQLGFGDRYFTRHSLYESSGQAGAFGLNCSPWTNPEIYIKNSPIFKIGKISTPLLMIHGSGDASVPFEQGVELFTGLRRAGKPVWLLQYLKEDGHVLAMQIEAKKDLTIKMKSFFDYYLKEQPMPYWMVAEQ